MLLMLDNYDSFTYNLVHYIEALGEQVYVLRNDQTSLSAIEALAPDRIVISPGPCSPNEAGISNQVIAHFSSQIPILGVCLGHQCLAQNFGGKTIRAKQVMHGKTSTIVNNGQGLFQGLPSAYQVTRYHSLVTDKHKLPPCFDITAFTQDQNNNLDEIMAIQHKHLPLFGVQFHPESVLTEHGHALINNFLTL